MKNFKSIVCIMLLLSVAFGGFSQVGPNGQRSISRAGNGTLGNVGAVQIGGPSPQGNGPLAAVSGFEYDYTIGRLQVDSLPITNTNNFISVDTTVTDTVLLQFGVTNILVNKWSSTVTGITTLVYILPIPPTNVTSLSGSQADNFVTKVKYGPGVANTSGTVIKKRPDTGYLTIYSGVSAKASDTKDYFYTSGSATYY